MATVENSIPARHRRVLRPLVVAAVCGTLLGVATAYGQALLPTALASLANSAGPWALVAFLLAMTASRKSVAAGVGVLSLATSLGGYVLGAALRGYPSSTGLLVFWGMAAILVGPVLGLAGCAARGGSPVAAALGAGAMSGVLVGEGVYGLNYIADTTYPPYWYGSAVVGVALLTWVAVWRLRRVAPLLLAVATTIVVAAAFVIVYGQNLIGLFG